MKILLVVRWPVGGIRTYLKYMLNDESLRDHEYTILLPNIDSTSALQSNLSDLNVNFVLVNGGQGDFFKQTLKQVLTGGFDLVHAHGFMAAMLSLPALLMSKTKFVVSSHDVFAQSHFAGKTGKLRKLFLKLLFWRANVLNVLGEDARQNLFEYFPKVNSDKVVPIRNGIVTSGFFSAEDEGLKSELSIADETVLIGFLGRFMGQKGFKYLLSAVEQIVKNKQTDIDFKILAIDAQGGWEQSELVRIKELGLEQYFIFIPPRDSIASLLAGLDLVAIPSVWECCPLLPMESLTVGTPVLASNCIGLKEIVKGSPAVTFESQNADDLKEKLLLMLSDQNKDAFKSFKGEAKQNFDVSVAAKKLAQVYQ